MRCPDNQLLVSDRSFDWDGNAEWKSYLCRVEIPSGNASALDKVKAKWYKRSVDPDFDPAWVSSSTSDSTKPGASSNAAGASKVPPTSSSTNVDRRGASYGTSTSSSSARPGAASQGVDRLGFNLALLHATVLVCTVLYINPVYRRFEGTCFRLAMQSAVIAQGIKVFQKHGRPTFTLAGLQAWFMQASQTLDFSYLMTGLVFLQQMPLSLVLVPYAVLAAYHLSASLNEKCGQNALWQKYGVKVHAWLAQRQRQSQVVSAAADIGLGFVLLLMLFTKYRSFLAAFFIWNTLKMRYWLPESAAAHRQVWSWLDQQSSPLRAQFPALETAVGYAKRYFSQGPMAPR